MTVLVIAECGLNHNGNVETAHRMIDAAADSGADAAKFQCYRTTDFVADRTSLYNGRPQYGMFERCELPDHAWRELKAHCDARGIIFFATPTSEERLQLLVDLNVPYLKNGSDYLTHLPLIRAMARTGIPTIISTGMATSREIQDAVYAYNAAAGTGLTLMHCTSTYPTPATDVNLRRIPTLASTYGLPVGFSDHTISTTAATGAVALGATMVEKHFTLDRNQDGPDHWFSANPEVLRMLVDRVRTMEQMLGAPGIRPAASEQQAVDEFRLSCVAAHDLPAGHVMTDADIAFARPGTGRPPKDAAELVGRTVHVPFVKGELL